VGFFYFKGSLKYNSKDGCHKTISKKFDRMNSFCVMWKEKETALLGLLYLLLFWTFWAAFKELS